jgi:hypothetical protein
MESARGFGQLRSTVSSYDSYVYRKTLIKVAHKSA